jgi:hypothetical protein
MSNLYMAHNACIFRAEAAWTLGQYRAAAYEEAIALAIRQQLGHQPSNDLIRLICKQEQNGAAQLQ